MSKSMAVAAADVLRFRVRAQQLDREPGTGTVNDTAVLDLGVQDTGPDGGSWALAIRGVNADAVTAEVLSTVWALRGAPHLYRRAELASVAAAVAPFSEADAGKRIYDAARPLRAAGIGILEALDEIAGAMRGIVVEPMVKGEVSGRLATVLGAPYLRFCRPCNATHLHEQSFRLAALRAGLELDPDTSPPVLRPIPGFVPAEALAVTPDERHDVIRAMLRLLGPAEPKAVAGFLDAPVAEVRRRWPDDTLEVQVDGRRSWMLAEDADALAGHAQPAACTRLLGPFDLFLQARDRHLLVEDEARAKALWPVLGRPGAVLANGVIVGTWRARKSGLALRIAVTLWVPPDTRLTAAIDEQAERLAAHRRVRLVGVDMN